MIATQSIWLTVVGWTFIVTMYTLLGTICGMSLRRIVVSGVIIALLTYLLLLYNWS